ncbi:efflux RND transporter periplasmic adaptor subunit [Paracoccus aminophilus]|uniref:RND family efflux transporter n=1 Tax=Paracoccus aminophilus JCM 7686 TaxID=1367847 RepID=S5XVM3_PARAH|nr:efflux RND transporter periplasmic adaptor subunit [Paracoccus aminophilus]AGT07440.1 RND family efflux transporter [Paracoccus aminophilus JCM 7686]
MTRAHDRERLDNRREAEVNRGHDGNRALDMKSLILPFLLLLAATPLRAEAPAQVEVPLLVEIVTVKEAPLTFDTTLAGSIQARDTVNIGFRQGGRIAEVMVSEGDHVTKDQPLARTDALQQEQALNVAQAKLASAEASRDQSAQARTRAAAMLDHGVGTRAGLDSADQALSAAEGGVTQARTELEQAQRALEDTVLRAPTDSVVTNRSVEVGQIVAAAQTVISLAATSGLEAVFQTPDLPLLKNALGVPVSIEGIDLHLPAMKASVREISPLVDPHTGSVTVRAYIDGVATDTALLGAAVRGTVHFPAGRGISVPWTALTANAEGPAVWTVTDEMRVTLTPITIERFTTESVVVASGLSAGAQVVGAGSQMLFPGRKIAAAGDAP